MVDVVFLGRFGTCCGVSTYAEQLAEQLLGLGMSVAAAASTHGHAEGGPHRTDCPEGIQIAPCWGEDGNFDEAYDVIVDIKPRVVHVQHEHGIFRNRRGTIALLKRLREHGIKAVLTLHTVPVNEDASMLALVMNADGIIAHSHRACGVLRGQFDHLGIKDAPPVCHIAHGMLPPQRKVDRKEARAELGIPTNDNVVVALALGFISRTKKHMVMLQVLEAIHDRAMCHPQKLFLLIAGMPDPHGGDELVRVLHRMSKKNGTDKHLLIIPEFVPFERLPVLYGASDLALHVRGASQLSSSGSIRQDMSYGMPVLTQRSELTEDLPHEAVMFFANDQSLLTLLPAMVRNGGLRSELSRNAFLMARKYDWRRTAEHHVRFYEAVTSAPMVNRNGILSMALSQATHWLEHR